MDVLRQIRDAKSDGRWPVLTEGDLRVFEDFDECESFAGDMAGKAFVVMRVLWSGGRAQQPASENSVSPADSLRQALQATVDQFSKKSDLAGPGSESSGGEGRVKTAGYLLDARGTLELFARKRPSKPEGTQSADLKADLVIEKIPGSNSMTCALAAAVEIDGMWQSRLNGDLAENYDQPSDDEVAAIIEKHCSGFSRT
jgi:hypothetical protein